MSENIFYHFPVDLTTTFHAIPKVFEIHANSPE
jgi:hypothetical protein